MIFNYVEGDGMYMIGTDNGNLTVEETDLVMAIGKSFSKGDQALERDNFHVATGIPDQDCKSFPLVRISASGIREVAEFRTSSQFQSNTVIVQKVGLT